MTRGHNIVADGWPGKSKPPPTHSLTHAQTHNRSIKNARFFFFFNFQLDRDGPLDQWTMDQQTDQQMD